MEEAKIIYCSNCRRYEKVIHNDRGYIFADCGNPAPLCSICGVELHGLEVAKGLCSICATAGNHANTAFGSP